MHGRSTNLNYLVRLVKRPAYRGTVVFLYHAKSNVAFTLIFTIIRNVPQSQIIKKWLTAVGAKLYIPARWSNDLNLLKSLVVCVQSIFVWVETAFWKHILKIRLYNSIVGWAPQKTILAWKASFSLHLYFKEQKRTKFCYFSLALYTLLKYGGPQAPMEILLLLTFMLFFCSSNYHSQGFRFAFKAYVPK